MIPKSQTSTLVTATLFATPPTGAYTLAVTADTAQTLNGFGVSVTANSSGNKVTVVVYNRGTAAAPVTVTLPGFPSAGARLPEAGARRDPHGGRPPPGPCRAPGKMGERPARRRSSGDGLAAPVFS